MTNLKFQIMLKYFAGLSARERPFLWTYRLFKSSFGPESYLFNVKDQRYQTAITRIRASSHIECCRYSTIQPSNVQEMRYGWRRETLRHELCYKYKWTITVISVSSMYFPDIDLLNITQRFVFLMCSVDKQIQKWFGRIIHQSFEIRSELL